MVLFWRTDELSERKAKLLVNLDAALPERTSPVEQLIFGALTSKPGHFGGKSFQSCLKIAEQLTEHCSIKTKVYRNVFCYVLCDCLGED